jgi:hypothetical protein
MILSNTFAIDFKKLKEDIYLYIDALDHPNREGGNIFNKNLAIAGDAINTKITIYSVGLAMVTEEKNVTIDRPGNVKIMYKDIPSAVDLSSVSMVFDKNVTLYSQKYAYDIVNFTSLLRRYIGKYILYIKTENDKKQKKATLLAMDPIIIQDLKSGNIFTPFKVFFENIPEDMAVTPTLFWDVNTQAKELGIKLEYLADKIIWKSDYNLYLKENNLFDLNSWITITNNSGASYTDANITIVTGQVKQVEIKEDNNTIAVERNALRSVGLAKKSDSEYSIYTVPHIEELKNKEEKQISFIHGTSIAYYEYLLNEESYDLNDTNLSEIHFSKILAFDNSKSNHLGTSLPQGIVRIYNYDTLSNKRFIGSTNINNIKEDETVELTVGESKEIIGEEKVISSDNDGLQKHITYTIKLKNSSNKIKIVKLKRALKDKVGDVSVKDSCQEQCKKENIDELTNLYTIELKPNQIYELEIKYLINTKADIKKGTV